MGLIKAPMTSDRPLYDEFYDGYRLFIGDLTEQVITADVTREFSKFGDLIDVWVARSPPGFGFVVFHNKMDCERCRRKLNGKTVFDRPLRIEFARPTAIRNDRRAPASYQAYIAKMRERGVEPNFAKRRSRSRSRSAVRRDSPVEHRNHHRSYRSDSPDYKTADLETHRRHSTHSSLTVPSAHRRHSESSGKRDQHDRNHNNRMVVEDHRRPSNRHHQGSEDEGEKMSLPVVTKHTNNKEEQKVAKPSYESTEEESEEESNESSLSESSDTESDSDSE